MKKTWDIVYVNNLILGHFEDNVYKNYSKEEKNELFAQLKKEVIKKDTYRKKFSFFLGLFLLTIAILIALLMILKVFTLGTGQWFNYTFLLVFFVFLWVLFYYLCGFIFYSKMNVHIYFKNHKTTQPNSCERYASSNYCKWVNQYRYYLSITNFILPKGNKKKTFIVPFSLRMPSSFKNLIFNGHLSCNVPYYYLNVKNKKILFLPGMVWVIDGKNSDVFSSEELKVQLKDNVYQLYKNNEWITQFQCDGEFNINFFYFKYEQI